METEGEKVEMNLKLEIKRNSDGKIATDIWPDWDYNTYWWEEGNAACDCNREIFFLSALNEEEPEESDCGRGKYSVRITDAEEVLYDEIK